MKHAVENVLSEKNALTGMFNGKAVPFSKEEEARLTLAEACEKLGADIRQSLHLNDDETLTALIAKLAAYCTKQGWKTGAEIKAGMDKTMPAIASAINDKPAAVIGKAGIAGIIKAWQRKDQQIEAQRRKAMINDNSAPPVHILRSGDYDLIELLNIRHLKEETEVLGHCIGNMYNSALLKEYGIPASSPEANKYLVYGIKIRSGESRIFSLRTAKGKPCATIEYDTARKCIKQMQGKPSHIPYNAPFMKSLCGALYKLREMIDLSGGIRDLHVPAGDVVITRQGLVSYDESVRMDDVLAGEVILWPEMEREEVTRLAKCANMRLNITHVDNEFLNSRLPHKVAARLYTKQMEPLELDYVLEAREIHAEDALKINMPLLDKATEIRADSCEVLEMPNLIEADVIVADSTLILDLPSLKRVSEIVAHVADKVNLPSAQSIREMNVWAAKEINVPAGSCAFLNGAVASNIAADRFSPEP